METPVVSVQAEPRDAVSWVALARRVEAGGYDALLAADHPGTAASPFVALAAAASVTERLGLGSYVSHAGIREPLLLASDVATLDLVSGGRARLALGAGHTPAEWEMLGTERPDVAGRVRRFVAVAESSATCPREAASATVPRRASRCSSTARIPVRSSGCSESEVSRTTAAMRQSWASAHDSHITTALSNPAGSRPRP